MAIEFDELALPLRGTLRPPALPANATTEEVVTAVNALALAARTHSLELEGIRQAMQAQGTRIETFCLRVERALGAPRRPGGTDPAPRKDEEA